jgi:HK97 family phage prohead protease
MSDPDFNIGGTLKAEEDEKGLRVHVKLDLDNPKALSTYRLLKGRRIRQMSFAYDVIAGGYATRPKAGQENEENPELEEYYELRELKLYEVSVVPVGANQETEILAVKSLEHLADRIEAMHKLDGEKAGRVLSSKNEEELRGAYDAIGRVLATIDGASDEEKASGTGPSRQDSEASESREASEDQPSVDTSELDRLSLDLELSL